MCPPAGSAASGGSTTGRWPSCPPRRPARRLPMAAGASLAVGPDRSGVLPVRRTGRYNHRHPRAGRWRPLGDRGMLQTRQGRDRPGPTTRSAITDGWNRHIPSRCWSRLPGRHRLPQPKKQPRPGPPQPGRSPPSPGTRSCNRYPHKPSASPGPTTGEGANPKPEIATTETRQTLRTVVVRASQLWSGPGCLVVGRGRQTLPRPGHLPPGRRP